VRPEIVRLQKEPKSERASSTEEVGGEGVSKDRCLSMCQDIGL
jgi:hypothetical protein